MTVTYPEPGRRKLITASTMLAATMVTLDGTIATIALPHIQSSLSASFEQIVWVITSYIVAGAIATPLSGWLATRYGRKLVMVGSVAGFTVSSIACGLASNLVSLVVFRFVQGATGAAMIPMSQATLLDINPPQRHGPAMALYGLGSMLGGILGPALGGFLTDLMSWRALFLINVPFGVIATAGMAMSMSETRKDLRARFDMTGFVLLSIFLAAMQLAVDRGQQLDWLDSTEIRIQIAAMALSFYLFMVHMFTAANPFIKPALFRDRNFSLGSVVSTALGLLIFGAMPMFGTMLQQLMHYPVLLAGLVTAPRGVATAVTMIITGRLIARTDKRVILVAGALCSALGFWLMSRISLEMDQASFIIAGLFIGAASGFLFVPLSTTVFSTLDPRLRNEGASVFALVRNVGSSVGISALQVMTIRNAAAVQSRLGEEVRIDNPVFSWRFPDLDPAQVQAALGLDGQIIRQAMMVAYIDAYWLLFVLSLAMIPVIALLRPARTATAPMAAAIE